MAEWSKAKDLNSFRHLFSSEAQVRTLLLSKFAFLLFVSVFGTAEEGPERLGSRPAFDAAQE